MTLLALTDEHARMGKISNNLETHGEAESKITGFTLPLEMRISRYQLVTLMGAEFDAAVWENDERTIDDAVPWARRCSPLALTDEVYVGVESELVLAGPTPGHELKFLDCRVSKLELVGFDQGDYTRVKCHLYVRPGIGHDNLLLQEYQEHEIAVQITSGKLRVKADKAQQQLPLTEPSASSAAPERAEDQFNAADPKTSAAAAKTERKRRRAAGAS